MIIPYSLTSDCYISRLKCLKEPFLCYIFCGVVYLHENYLHGNSASSLAITSAYLRHP